MKDMFYNYEHDIDKKDFPILHFEKKYKVSENYHGVEYIRNAAGDILGVKSDRNSTFDVYFYLDGSVENGSIFDLVNQSQFYLEILNSKGKVITKLEAIKFSSDTLKITIEANDSIMPNGLYSLRLTMIYEDKAYTLFKENDATLYIK